MMMKECQFGYVSSGGVVERLRKTVLRGGSCCFIRFKEKVGGRGGGWMLRKEAFLRTCTACRPTTEFRKRMKVNTVERWVWCFPSLGRSWIARQAKNAIILWKWFP